MITDEALRRAAAIAEERLMSSLPEPEDCDFEPSGRFRRGMKGVFQRAEHPVLFWAKRGAACLLLAFFIGSAALLTFSTEARAAFFGWIKNSYDTYFIYQYDGEVQEFKELKKYYPTWVPDGYWEVTGEEDHEMGSYVYLNDEGQVLSFGYAQKNYNTDSSLFLTFGENGAETHTASVNGYPAEIHIARDNDQQNAVVWTNEKENTLFFISAFLSEDELIKMAESVEVAK